MTMISATETISELKGFWNLLFPKVTAPDDSQWALWLLRHDNLIVRHGLTELATKYIRLKGTMDQTYMAKFASAVMNRLSRELTEEKAHAGQERKKR